MESGDSNILLYQRAKFAARLPVGYSYHPGHIWLDQEPDGVWRVGLTKFATRMLGEMVDHGFQVQPASPVEPGQIIGWIEGFKAISDIYCIVKGEFVMGNPALSEQSRLLHEDPCGEGWIYRARGTPDAQCGSVYDYQALLDKTIDQMRSKE
jgi:glycine cleavage system H protein